MIALGVVGWDDSISDPQDKDTATNVTLVRVTLVNDHDVLADLREGKAYGKEIVAQAMGTLSQEYVAGMRVVVAIPDGLESAPGAAVILGVLAHPPTDFVALAQKTKDEITTLRNKVNDLVAAFNAHIHLETGGSTNPPTASPSPVIPVTAPATVNSVAAAESKGR